MDTNYPIYDRKLLLYTNIETNKTYTFTFLPDLTPNLKSRL